MVERTAAMAANAMGGAVVAGDPQTRWRGAAIDSRRVRGGEIFFALPGERVDGHDFVAQAAEQGAAAIVVHRPLPWPSNPTCAWIQVDDTFAGLHALCRAVRRQVPQQLVAITGSVGKTTTKEFLAGMLARRFKVARSQGNLNNLYGFPVSLLNIPDDSEWMVAEMGMSTPGELRQISLLGQPDVVLLINVRPVHLENFDDLAGIAEAKAEILAGLTAPGVIIANADDPEVMRVAIRHADRHPGVRVVSFGASPAADARLTPPIPLAEGRVGCRFTVTIGGEGQDFELPVHGLYNASNCLAATTAAYLLGVPLSVIAAAAADLRPSTMRGEVHRLAREILLIDDSYNSNPEAVARALESTRLLPGGRHVAVLGAMLELGPRSAEFHQQAGVLAAGLGFSPILGVGSEAENLVAAAGKAGADATWCANAQLAASWLSKTAQAQDVILVKGSRGIGLEAVVARMLQGEAG